MPDTHDPTDTDYSSLTNQQRIEAANAALLAASSYVDLSFESVGGQSLTNLFERVSGSPYPTPDPAVVQSAFAAALTHRGEKTVIEAGGE